MSRTVLVTNDDGIDSPGLLVLVRAALAAGLRPVVAAPREEASGTGAGLTAAAAGRRVVSETRELPGLPDVPGFAVAATPGLIVLVACRGAFGPRPDLVLSGVNRGGNVGRALLHSGTVGAALTAASNGVTGIAVSLDVDLTDLPEDPHWASTEPLATGLAAWARRLPAGTVLNVNVPDRPVGELGRPRWATLAGSGRVGDRLTRVEDGVVELATVRLDGEPEPGSDAALLAAGHPTVTVLHGVGADAGAMREPLPDLG
jgi:5'-nucleotidase